ncbi:Trk system potassium transporter TrkA [Lacrimispora sp.]|uniref:Trk system potassium transporter TrkA n=1 Tax=Lacrimispora sp. TaxID=2719234 RepID=UPI0032E39233
MKIIIVGCGKVGTTLAEQLNKEHHDIVIIDKNAGVVNSISERIDVMGVVGNGAVNKVQMDAGIEDTDLLIATTNSDELNMLCCLIAKKAGNCHTIARIRNPEYDSQIGYIREELGLSLAINPEMAAAMEIARLLRFPSAIKIDTFAKGKKEILKFIVPDHSVLNNMKVRDVLVRLKCNVLICAIEHNAEVIIPGGDSIISAGDKISFIASPVESNEFFKQVGIDNNVIKTAMLVGGGKITYYVAKMLENTKIKVKILEQNAERCNELSELLPRAMVINGDASDQELLLQEGVGQIDAFASLTGFDEENIMLSLYAASQSKAKLITKINRIAFENVIDSMNLGSIIYPKLITAETILQYVRAMQNSMGSNVETLYKIVADRAEALEFKVVNEPCIVGIPLEKLELKDNLLVAYIMRKGRFISPRGKDTLEEGDRVIVVTTVTGLNDLKDILR